MHRRTGLLTLSPQTRQMVWKLYDIIWPTNMSYGLYNNFQWKIFPSDLQECKECSRALAFVRVHQTPQTKEQQTEVWVCKSLQLPAPAATAALRPMTLAKSLQCHVIQSSRRTPDLFLIKENFWLFPQPIFFSISNSIVLDAYTFNIYYFLFLE